MDHSHIYTIQLIPAEEGGYVVTVPALPGCFTQAESYEEALAMAREAISCHLESLAKHGEAIPVDEPEHDPLIARVRVSVPLEA